MTERGAGAGPAGTILVVDDDRLAREGARDALQAAGYRVLLAAGAGEALARLRAERADAVLLDLILGDGDGLEMLPALHGLDPDLPVVILTGYGGLESAIEALRQGATDFLRKPFRAEAVLPAVRKALERRRVGLRNRGLVLQLGRKVNELTALHRIGETINSTLDLTEILQAIVAAARDALAADASALMLVDEATGDLRFEVAVGSGGPGSGAARLPRGRGILGWVAERGEAARVAEAAADPRFAAEVDAALGAPPRAMVAVPLKAKGRTIGVLQAMNLRAPDACTDDDLRLLTLIAAQAALAIENAKLYRRVQQQLAALQELEALKEHLSQLIVHDLQNPLAGVALTLDMLQASGGRAEGFPYLEDARRACRHLRALLSDLLDIGRMEEGKLALDVAEFSLEDVVEETLAELGPIAHDAQQRLEFAPGRPLPKVRADRALVYRVLANLVSNAIHHSPPGGAVTVAAEADPGGGVRVRVADRGEGIPAAWQDRIFEKYVRGDSAVARYRAGRGLGLTFCRMAVEAHGGRIGVESAPGRGSTFTFTLPPVPAVPDGPRHR